MSEATGGSDGVPPGFGRVQPETNPQQGQCLVDHLIGCEQKSIFFQPAVTHCVRCFIGSVSGVGARHPARGIDEEKLHRPQHAIMLRGAQSVLAAPDRLCPIQAVPLQRNNHGRADVRGNNLKCRTAAVQNKKRSAPSRTLDNPAKPAAQLLCVNGFKGCFHVQLKLFAKGTVKLVVGIAAIWVAAQ
jgi:hypothetical protein